MKRSKLKGELRSLDFDASGNPKHQSVTRQSFLRFVRHPDAATLAIGVVIALGVCAPLLGGGRVFLLDWSLGPHVAVANPGTLGLNGGVTAGIVSSVVVAMFNHPLGGAATWLPILVFFPIAAVGAGRLAGRLRWSRLAAGTLYAVNPFVFNRLYVGHLPLLIGYALLPFATAAVLRSLSAPASRWPVPALWWAVLTALSPHFAWIFGVVVVGVVVVAVSTSQHPIRRVVGWFAAVVGAFALMSTYILLPHTTTGLLTQIGRVSLALYRTSGDPHLGLFANVLALYGFWRLGPGPELPKNVISGWPFLILAIVLIAAFGAWHAVRKGEPRGNRIPTESPSEDRTSQPGAEREISTHEDFITGISPQVDQRRLAFLLLFVGVAGFFLALGDQGPTGGLFLWTYEHVPFFAVMREPQKFLMLLALAYAVFFGWGVERMSQVSVSPRRVGAIATAAIIGVILPLGYTPNIFGGLAGQITSTSLPSTYQRADALMATGSGNILALPWHLYMEYPFTNGRVVANVAPSSFRRNVISGDNVESGGVETQSTSPRSAYLQQLFANGPITNVFGALVAPLGVQYVVLAKTVDWTSYNWLANQKELRLVLNTSSLEVWRNMAYVGVGQRVTKLTSVSSVSGLLTLARSNELNGGAVVKSSSATNSSNSSAVVAKGVASAGSTSKLPTVQQLSPVAYRVASGRPGWVTVDAPYERGWSLNGRSATATAEGTLLVRVGKDGGVLRFTPWAIVRLGYILSGGVFIVLAVFILVERRRRTTRAA
jgi:hypothetical protein